MDKAELLGRILEKNKDVFVESGEAYCNKCNYSRMFHYKSKSLDIWVPCICRCQFDERERAAREKAKANNYAYEPKIFEGKRLIKY